MGVLLLEAPSFSFIARPTKGFLRIIRPTVERFRLGMNQLAMLLPPLAQPLSRSSVT